MNRFARYWDLVGNSGRFKVSLSLLLLQESYERFAQFVDALYLKTGQTHKISLLRLYDLVFDIGVETLNICPDALKKAIKEDYSVSGLKSIPKCLTVTQQSVVEAKSKKTHKSRQSRHSLS